MLNLKAILATVKVYGQPLYNAVADVDLGTIETAGQYAVDTDGKSLLVDGAFIPIRTATLEADGYDPATHLFSVGQFKALRDADGMFNGNPWSVTAGEMKTFAY